MQQGAEQFNPTVQTPSLPTEPSKPGPSTQKSRERWQTSVLVQLWADNIDRLESKDSRKAWDEIVRALNDKQGKNSRSVPAQAEAPQEPIQRKEGLEPQTKWGKYPKEPPLRCHRRGARLQGCNNLQ